MPKRTIPAERSVNTNTTSTTPARGKSTPPSSTIPRLPHERDQSVGMTDGVPSPKVQQAYRDVTQGQQDTGLSPVTNHTYEKLKK